MHIFCRMPTYLLLIFNAAFISLCLIALSPEEQWLKNLLEATPAKATKNCMREFRGTPYYKGLQAHPSPYEDQRALLEALCGRTIPNKAEYQTLFGSLSNAEKENPLLQDFIGAMKNPTQGCAQIGTRGAELQTLNKTHKEFLCQACNNSKTRLFAHQAQWPALQATCGDVAAKESRDLVCAEVKAQKKSAAIVTVEQRQLLAECHL